MNPTANQIFDLLLGTIPSSNGATAGRSINGESGELFNELLTGLLGDGSDVLAQLSGATDSQNLVESINRGNGKPDDLSAFVEQIADRYGTAKQSVFTNAKSLPILEHSLTRLGELQPGTYSIIEADSTNGQLHLSLESPEGEQIKLTLPADAFAKGKTSVDVSDSKANLEKLFAKLNLKEMVIEKSASELNQKTNKSHIDTIKLISENKTNELVLRSRIDIQNTPIVIEKPAGPQLPGELQQRNFGRSMNSSKVVESMLNKNGIDELIKLTPVDKTEQAFLRSESNQGLERILNSHSSSTSETKAFDQTEIKNAQMARFTLPDDLNQTLKPNGRSLMLQIEPEHLGKARIHLAMKSDGLTARVVVDSQIARQAVEAGMDRLLDQLHKAHINVDSIDVSVGGNSDDNGQLAQHRFFNNRPRMVFNKSLENETLESAATVAAAHQLYGGGMISQSGVNVLA